MAPPGNLSQPLSSCEPPEKRPGKNRDGDTVNTGLLGREEGPGILKSEGQSPGAGDRGMRPPLGRPRAGVPGRAEQSVQLSPRPRLLQGSLDVCGTCTTAWALGPELRNKPPGSSGGSRWPPPRDSHEISPLFLAKLSGVHSVRWGRRKLQKDRPMVLLPEMC